MNGPKKRFVLFKNYLFISFLHTCMFLASYFRQGTSRTCEYTDSSLLSTLFTWSCATYVH